MSLSTRKQCSIVSGCKQTAATNCEGCSEAFCTKHFLDHRRLLTEDMDVLIGTYNQLQQVFSQQPTELESQPFVKIIDEWEKESIVKIQQKAKDLRVQFVQLATVRNDEISKKLRQSSEKLNETRQNDNFIEMDLQQWKTILEELTAKVKSSSIFSLEQYEDSSLVKDISVILAIENESFERVFDNTVQIQQNGQVINHDTSFSYSEIRGKNEYISGRHKIRLCIEQSAGSWTFLGINSKLMLLQKQSCSSKSTYGWSSNNYFWLEGECHPNKSASRIEIKSNDTISLMFDCDNRKIFMINERTSAKYELTVNIEHCPFPWQLHLNMFEANSRIRILSA